MRTIAGALATHLAGEVTTLATCWKVTFRDATVAGYTDHDRDLVVDGLTYLAASGYTASDVETTSALNVDNLEIVGLLSADSITEDDLLAGVWDGARVEIFSVNWASPSDGKIRHRKGTIGEVSVDQGKFKAELRGLMQAYTTTLVELTSPTCRANLGDVRCGVDTGALAVTGTVDSVSSDGMTIFDAGRTEAGPSTGIGIASITNANPGVVTLEAPLDLPEDTIVNISGVNGMTSVNGTTPFRNPNDDRTTFELLVDTTALDPYVANDPIDAFVTPLAAESGYFDRGVITWTSGDNNGLSQEVKAYAAGQIALVLPMPYAIQAGDAYSLTPGCDKLWQTCRDKFDNIPNFRGEPWLPGFDAMVQVGRRS